MIFAAVKLSNYRLATVCVGGVQVPRTFQVSVYLLRPHYMWFTVYNKYTFEYKKQVKLKNSYLPPYLGLKYMYKIYMQISFHQFKIQFDSSVKVSNNGGHIQVVMLTYQKIGVDLSIQLQLYL